MDICSLTLLSVLYNSFDLGFLPVFRSSVVGRVWSDQVHFRLQTEGRRSAPRGLRILVGDSQLQRIALLRKKEQLFCFSFLIILNTVLGLFYGTILHTGGALETESLDFCQGILRPPGSYLGETIIPRNPAPDAWVELINVVSFCRTKLQYCI